jgi:hypothetical protein
VKPALALNLQLLQELLLLRHVRRLQAQGQAQHLTGVVVRSHYGIAALDSPRRIRLETCRRKIRERNLRRCWARGDHGQRNDQNAWQSPHTCRRLSRMISHTSPPFSFQSVVFANTPSPTHGRTKWRAKVRLPFEPKPARDPRLESYGTRLANQGM